MTSSLGKYWYVLLILLLLLLAGMFWANYRFVEQNPGGNDFLVHWVGTRALLVDGLSPYSDEVALQIQTLAYGRPARAGEHELRVAYPLYSIYLFAPFALISDYTLARALWMTTLEAGLVAMTFLSLSITTWRPKPWMLALLLLFSLTWYHSARAVINGNAVILVSLFVVGALAAIKSGKDELAGILLAISTIKPQVTILVILYIWVWAISVRRWAIVIWTLITVAILTGTAMFFIPNWPLQNLWEILRYPGYNPPGTPGAVFSTWWPAFGDRIGWGLTIVLGIILVGEWILSRKQEFRWFIWTASLTLVASQWSGFQTDPGNFIILYFPLVLVFAVWEEKWGRRGRPIILLSLGVLLVGLWALFLATVENTGQPQQHPIMFLPLPLFLLIGLYWVRWWAIKPAKLLIEALRSSDES